MLINNEIKNIVEEKYQEMLKNSETNAVLSHELLGELSLFIDVQPAHYFMSFEIDGKKLYVGSNTIEALK